MAAYLAETRKRRLHWTTRIVLLLGALVLFAFIAIAGYRYLDSRYSFLEALYMTVITLTTVGYGEVEPTNDATKIWTIFVILGGLSTTAVVFAMLGGMIVESRLRNVLGRRVLEKKIASLKNHAIVCGYGRTGTMVAEELKTAGKDVVIIDSEPNRTTAADQAGLLYVLGDAQEEDVLKAAGVERADVLVTALTNDPGNVFVTLSARQANPTVRIIARAEQPGTQDKLRKAGATRTVCPATIGAARITDVVLRPAVVDFFDVAHDGVELEMEEIELTGECGLVDKTLAELELPKRIGVHVVAIRRADGKAVYTPTPDMKLGAGDTLILVGKKGINTAVHNLVKV